MIIIKKYTWVNLNDVAEYLSVSTDTIRNWIKSEKIPY
ncbi:MAG: helix-turn-helix domain-containing protein [Candidatus Fimenecus sp.]